MILTFRRLTSNALLIIFWLLITAGVAFLVARATGPEDSAPSIPGDPGVISLGTRSTVVATPKVIAAVISFNGQVTQDGEGWLLEAPVTLADVAYRLIDPPIAVKALISGGPAGFDCAWAGTGQAPDGSVTARCEIPADIRVIPGLAGIMALQFDEPVAAETALPVSAVLGSTTQGQVIVVSADGARTLRSVQIGASDGLWIEITGGLQPGDQVLEFPTQRDFAEAGE